MNGSAVALLAFLFLLNLTQVARLVSNIQEKMLRHPTWTKCTNWMLSILQLNHFTSLLKKTNRMLHVIVGCWEPDLSTELLFGG